MKITKFISKTINFLRLFKKRNHRYKIKKAAQVLTVLESIKKDNRTGKAPRALAYLRKIHPSAFEELALSMLERENFFVLRNKAYTGDGGIDGWVHIRKIGWIPIQSKRYSNYIQLSHLKDFNKVIKTKKSPFGIFIHTGKTGEESRNFLKETPILILSGLAFAECATGEQEIQGFIEQQIKRHTIISKIRKL